MSRSRKKPVYTEYSKSKKKTKRLFNKRIRRISLEDEVPSIKKNSQQYDITDFRFYSPDDKKAYRK